MGFKKNWLTPDCLSLLLLSASILWFSHEMLWEEKLPFFRDLAPYFYPIRFSVAQSFQVGELPLWDRQIAMGFPLLAEFQSAPFYLPHLLLGGLPFFDALRVLFLFHYVLAAFGSYVLARKWGYPVYLSLIGAALFTFGGVIISLTNLLNHFQTAVWLPWLIVTGERALESRSWKDFLILTGVALMQFLAGSPEFYLFSMGLLFLDAMRTTPQSNSVSWQSSILLIVAANVVLAGLAMAQLLPTVELFFQSRRPTHISYQEVTAWSLHPVRLINLFFLDKEVDLSLFSGFRLFFGREVSFLVTLYIGQISLIGLSSWFYYGSRREKIVLSCVVVITLALASGRYTPLYPFLLEHFAVLGLIRFPEKFFFLTFVFLLFAVLKGLKACFEDAHNSQKSALFIPCLILALLTSLYLWCRLTPGSFLTLYGGLLVGTESLPSILASFVFSLERQIFLLSAFLFLIFAFKLKKISAGIFRILLVGLVFVDLAAAHRPYQFLVDPKLATGSARILSTPDPKPYRLFSGFPHLHPSSFTFKDRPFPQVVASVWSSLVPNTGILYGFEYMQEIDALSRAPYDVFLKTAKDLPPEKIFPLLESLNIKYIASSSRLPKGDIVLIREFPEKPLWLYRLNRTVPRTYIASFVRHEKDPVKTLGQMASKTFNPFEEVVLHQPLSLPTNKRLQTEAEIIRYANQRVIIKASLNGAGILVLADSFYPGWRVFVNGAEKEILRANLFFRGVALPAGEHTVDFRYEPRSFIVGCVISLLSLTIIAVVTMWRCLRRRKRAVVIAPS